MGLRITLYKSSLFSVINLDFRPMSQCICRNLWLIWVFLAVMCGLHVSFWSSRRPRYLTSVCTGSCVPFIVTIGQSILRFVNVACTDLFSSTFIRQVAKWFRWVWRLWDAVCRSSLLASMAVSSANVAIVVSFLVGTSAVNIRYNRGPSTLLCGTPECRGSLRSLSYWILFGSSDLWDRIVAEGRMV